MSSASKRADEMALLAKYLVSYAVVQSAGGHQQAVYRKALASSEGAAGLAPKDHFVLTVHGSALHGLANALATPTLSEALVRHYSFGNGEGKHKLKRGRSQFAMHAVATRTSPSGACRATAMRWRHWTTPRTRQQTC